MGRTPDPEVARKRKQAAKFEREGLTGAQIAARMGEKVDTVYGWLKIERGPKKPPHKDKIIERLMAGMAIRRIASEVGCSEENVRFYEKKMRPHLKVQLVDTKDPAKWVDEWSKDPDARKNERYTRYESFGRALIARCNRAANTNPKAAIKLIELAMGQFSLMREISRKPEKARLLTCNLVQVTAILAAIQRSLDRPEFALGGWC